MMRIIHLIDTVGDQGVDVMPLQNASADQVVNVINQLYQGQAAAQMGRTFKVVADQRTNSVLISGDPAERLRIRALVAELDTPSSAGGDTVLEGTTLCVGTTSAGGLSVAAMLRALRGNADLDTGGLNPNPTLLPSITRFFGPSDSRSITGALLGARPGAVRALRVARIDSSRQPSLGPQSSRKVFEGAPGGAGKRPADAHPPHTHIGQIGNRQAGARQIGIDRLVQRRHQSGDGGEILDPRRIQAVCARPAVSGESGDGHLQVRLPRQERLAAPDEQHVLARALDRLARGAHSLHGFIEGIESAALAVFDRKTRHPGFDAAGDADCDALGAAGKTGFEISIDWQVGDPDQASQMLENLIHGHLAVSPAQGPGGPGAGGGDRLEAEPGQADGAAAIPGIGQNKATRLVQGAEGRASLENGGHRSSPNCAGGGANPRAPAMRFQALIVAMATVSRSSCSSANIS